jgi:hypothetical protein
LGMHTDALETTLCKLKSFKLKLKIDLGLNSSIQYHVNQFLQSSVLLCAEVPKRLFDFCSFTHVEGSERFVDQLLSGIHF